MAALKRNRPSRRGASFLGLLRFVISALINFPSLLSLDREFCARKIRSESDIYLLRLFQELLIGSKNILLVSPGDSQVRIKSATDSMIFHCKAMFHFYVVDLISSFLRQSFFPRVDFPLHRIIRI